ncbi:MAG: hypothetical protein JSS66_09190 [Armatimonadetes bacterium]|nr:hypothetical protein [Armatimonadota bacterium]
MHTEQELRGEVYVGEPVRFGDYFKKGHAEYESEWMNWLFRVKNGKWKEYGLGFGFYKWRT